MGDNATKQDNAVIINVIGRNLNDDEIIAAKRELSRLFGDIEKYRYDIRITNVPQQGI